MKSRESFLGGLFAIGVLLYGCFAIAFIGRTPEKGSAGSQVLGASVVNFYRPAEGPDPNRIFAEVNALRVRDGLSPLVADATLAEVAERRAQDMADRSYYAHRDPEGLYYYDWLAGTEFADYYSCENLDLNFTDDPQPYVRDWTDSTAGHKECALHRSVGRAGYAVAKMQLASGALPAYVVVAIHAR